MTALAWPCETPLSVDYTDTPDTLLSKVVGRLPWPCLQAIDGLAYALRIKSTIADFPLTKAVFQINFHDWIDGVLLQYRQEVAHDGPLPRHLSSALPSRSEADENIRLYNTFEALIAKQMWHSCDGTDNEIARMMTEDMDFMRPLFTAPCSLISSSGRTEVIGDAVNCWKAWYEYAYVLMVDLGSNADLLRASLWTESWPGENELLIRQWRRKHFEYHFGLIGNNESLLKTK